MKNLLLATLLFICFQSLAGDGFPVDYAEGTFWNYEKEQYESVLWSGLLQQAPEWDAEKSPPPLSPKKAALIAETAIQAQLGNHHLWPVDERGWTVTQVALVHGWPGTNTWYYRIALRPRVPGSNHFQPLTVFITLDGKAVPLTLKKKPQ